MPLDYVCKIHLLRMILHLLSSIQNYRIYHSNDYNWNLVFFYLLVLQKPHKWSTLLYYMTHLLHFYHYNILLLHLYSSYLYHLIHYTNSLLHHRLCSYLHFLCLLQDFLNRNISILLTLDDQVYHYICSFLYHLLMFHFLHTVVLHFHFHWYEWFSIVFLQNLPSYSLMLHLH